MAGSLVISTLNNDTGVLATQNGMTGIAKAWVQFTGSTGAINSSFNVSSITRHATGEYTVNFTTAMANANYSFALSTCNITGAASLVFQSQANAPTTTTIRFATTNTSGTTGDVDRASVAIFSS